jgi:hypothetical protein
LPLPSPGACASDNIRGRPWSVQLVGTFGRASRRGWSAPRRGPFGRTGFGKRARLRRWKTGRFVKRQLFGSRCHRSVLFRDLSVPEA